MKQANNFERPIYPFSGGTTSFALYAPLFNHKQPSRRHLPRTNPRPSHNPSADIMPLPWRSLHRKHKANSELLNGKTFQNFGLFNKAMEDWAVKGKPVPRTVKTDKPNFFVICRLLVGGEMRHTRSTCEGIVPLP